MITASVEAASASTQGDLRIYQCANVARSSSRPPLTLATHLSASAFDALAWLVTRSCHIAEQLDPEPRSLVQERVLAPEVQHHILRRVRECRHVKLEIADPEIVYELSVRPCPEGEA